VDVESNDNFLQDSTTGFSGGVRAAIRAVSVGRVGLGLDLAVSANQSDLVLSSGRGAQANWLQYDLRAAIAYLPSADSAAAVSPYAGVGFRAIDGVIEPDAGGWRPNFDARLTYAFVGIAAEMRPSHAQSIGLDVLGMVGQVSGVMLLVSFSF
jgi:hypothetical protein